jgi:acyl-coenzyme A synthetase/AMP-(fatty) acid ligase/thioesterase domain-containing protein
MAWNAQLAPLRPAPQNVAICFSHSVEAVAAIIGTLSAGHSFIALDPTQPPATNAALSDYAEARVVLCLEQDALALKKAGWMGTAIHPPNEFLKNDEMCPATVKAAQRACLCFTSGSSANPKAVAWSHRTLACAAENLQAMFAFSEVDRHALLTPPSVAAAHAQIFSVLGAGATLCLFEARRHSISDLVDWLQRENITTLQTIPALIRALAREAAGRKMWPGLRAVKVGGEGSTVADARLFETFAGPEAVLINGLGLTEAGFNVCWFRWQPGQTLTGNILPIGVPPANLELIIEGANGPGEVGEIVVRSPALADGYWRELALTKRVYRDLPGRPGWRELHTGDMGQWRNDGLLEHCGRVDDVVMIRGHRVALAEVESLLAGIDGVAAVAVIPKRDADGSSRLCAFVQLHPASTATPSSLRAQAAARMADYMIPAPLRLIDQMPRLENGKADRRALLTLAREPLPATQHPEQLDALEQTLHGLFGRALSCRSFGMADSFFDLGGDSLSAASLFAAIEKVLGIDLPLTELVQHPTVESLAGRIRQAGWNAADHSIALLTRAPCPEARNLFAWPGAGSDAMAFHELARHLGSDVAFYAIQHRGTNGRRVYDLSVAAIADRSINLIRDVQPSGPYALCGTSFGGLVALEVAHRLRAAGETVAFLGLFDTYAPGYPAPRENLGLSGRLELLLRAMRPLGHKDERGLAILRRGLYEKRLRLAARSVVQRADPDAPVLPIRTRYIHLQEACLTASRSYRPQPYDGETHLFNVELQPNPRLFKPDETLGWRPWLTGPIHIATIPGRHGQHLREPYVRTLAARLADALALTSPA